MGGSSRGSLLSMCAGMRAGEHVGRGDSGPALPSPPWRKLARQREGGRSVPAAPPRVFAPCQRVWCALCMLAARMSPASLRARWVQVRGPPSLIPLCFVFECVHHPISSRSAFPVGPNSAELRPLDSFSGQIWPKLSNLTRHRRESCSPRIPGRRSRRPPPWPKSRRKVAPKQFAKVAPGVWVGPIFCQHWPKWASSGRSELDHDQH